MAEFLSVCDVKIAHRQRLACLLDFNGLEEVHVPADGNCLFASTLALVKQNNLQLTSANLREIVCDHMAEYPEQFEPFISGNYNQKVSEMRKEGHWNTELADATPLALANLFQARVMIYSSTPGWPLRTVIPQLTDSTHPHVNKDTFLLYSYLDIPEFQHYNALLMSQKQQENFVPVLNWTEDALGNISHETVPK